HDGARQRLGSGQENDERDRPEDVHQHVEHPEYGRVGQEAPAPGRVETETQDHPADAAEEQREPDDPQRLIGGLPQQREQFDEVVHQSTSVTATSAAMRSSATSIAASVPVRLKVRWPKVRPWMSLMPP